MMKHYVRQQVTKGISARTVNDYSARSIKEIVLHIMQKDFAKEFDKIKYDITTEKKDLLDKTQFYKTGLTYKQIKELPEEDIEDICMMITTDKNRASLNYVRICPYLHKAPIVPIDVVKKDKIFNGIVKPIKLKIMPKHLLYFYTELNSKTQTSGYYIKSELATAYNLTQGLFQTKDDVYNHVKTVLVNAGVDINHIDYSKIPKPIYDAMVSHSRYFKDDRKTSYHKRFEPFFRDYFSKQPYHTPSPSDEVYISPFLASLLKLDITKTHKKEDIRNLIIKLSQKDKQHLNYTTKNDYITHQKHSVDTTLNRHTYSSLITDDMMKKMKISDKLQKLNPLNVLKSGITLQRFYRTTVQPKIAARKASASEEVIKEPPSPKATATSSDTSSESEPPTPATGEVSSPSEGTDSETDSDSDTDTESETDSE